ncbi:unnamed protein product [Phytophthora lilii]|uniref:Unnamed protein product n=1 Tax=Phytophthora lilii TaxID=2077276 RepID=A0A9W6U7T3_9STRA|nr:unnamed protein product [Phytophthora lilii]
MDSDEVSGQIGRWTEAVQAYAASINVVLMKIPPGYTSLCQSADIAWMKPFKLRLRSLWVEHLQSELRGHQDRASGKKFKLKGPSRDTLMAWLTSAWENLPTATIASGFNRLAILMDKREFTAQDQQLCG